MDFSDFENFLKRLKEEWEAKQKSVEAKFLELSDFSDQLSTVLDEPKKKKRKAKKSRSVEHQQQDPFSSYAAQLQVEFFKKVQNKEYFTIWWIMIYKKGRMSLIRQSKTKGKRPNK